VNLTGESVWRKPFDHNVRVEERYGIGSSEVPGGGV